MSKWMSEELNQTKLTIDGIANGQAFFSTSKNDKMIVGIVVRITEHAVIVNNTTVKDLIEKHNGKFIIE